MDNISLIQEGYLITVSGCSNVTMLKGSFDSIGGSVVSASNIYCVKY